MINCPLLCRMLFLPGSVEFGPVVPMKKYSMSSMLVLALFPISLSLSSPLKKGLSYLSKKKFLCHVLFLILYFLWGVTIKTLLFPPLPWDLGVALRSFTWNDFESPSCRQITRELHFSCHSVLNIFYGFT